jgi:excisionase family DNA binding protein
MPKTLPNPAAVRGKETLTVEDVAVLIGCGRTVAYRLVADGSLPSYRIGRLRRVRRTDVENFIDSRVSGGESER